MMNIDEIIARLHELEEENSMLKSLLSKHGIAYEKAKPETVVLAQESEKAKFSNAQFIIARKNVFVSLSF